MSESQRSGGESPSDILVLYELPSILKAIDLRELFPREQPLEIELGAGDGSFLAGYASAHPDVNFIGTERLLGRIRKLERKARQRGLRNLRTVRIESGYFLRYLVPRGAARAIHIYFPDPWPKRKHERHRLINSEFVDLAAQVLLPGGCVYLRTDHPAYGAQMQSVFGSARAFRPAETPTALQEIKTDFEREFEAQGIRPLRMAYRKT